MPWCSRPFRTNRYTYTIISDPHPEIVGKTTTISVPREPVTLMVERSFYNSRIATRFDQD